MTSHNSIETLEKGSVFFFYRPKVSQSHPTGQADIQRMYMVMSPNSASIYRLALIGQKELPNPEKSGHRKYWGTVTSVAKDTDSIRNELGPREYETKTRGKRHIEAARAAGEGVYRIIGHESHTHFVYALELPKGTGDVQNELNIEQEASYVISIKNPDVSSPARVGLSREQEAQYPVSLKEKFRGRHFSELNPPDFLNYDGAEFILIAAASDVKDDLGIQLHPDTETAASADIVKDLHIDLSNRQATPLFKGQWE